MQAMCMQLDSESVNVTFGGVMGWEYFNGRPGGIGAPHQWPCIVSRLLNINKDELY